MPYRPQEWLAEIEAAAHDLGYFVESVSPGEISLFAPDLQATVKVSTVLLGGPILGDLLRPRESVLAKWEESEQRMSEGLRVGEKHVYVHIALDHHEPRQDCPCEKCGIDLRDHP